MAEEAGRELVGVFDRAAATYDTVIPFFATFGRALVEHATLARGEVVLDVAAGRGAVLFRRRPPSGRAAGSWVWTWPLPWSKAWPSTSPGHKWATPPPG